MRKIRVMTVILAAGLLGLTGCMSMGNGAAKAIAAAAKDPATQKLHFVCPYGSIDWMRVGSVPGQSTEVYPDGTLKVSSGQGTNLFAFPISGQVLVNPIK